MRMLMFSFCIGSVGLYPSYATMCGNVNCYGASRISCFLYFKFNYLTLRTDFQVVWRLHTYRLTINFNIFNGVANFGMESKSFRGDSRNVFMSPRSIGCVSL